MATNPFDGMARDYEAWHSTPKGSAAAALEREVLGSLLPPGGGGAPLLEVGCGTAFWFPFWRKSGYRPFGLDPSMPMLEKAREKGETGLVRARGEAPPFRPRSFRVVAFLTVLEFLPRPGEVLRRASALLAPGGILLAGVLDARSSLARNRKASGRPPWKEAAFFTPEDLESLLSPFGRPRIAPSRPLPPPFAPAGPGEGEPFFLAAAVAPPVPGSQNL